MHKAVISGSFLHCSFWRSVDVDLTLLYVGDCKVPKVLRPLPQWIISFLFPIVPRLEDICHMRRIDFWSATLNYWFLTIVSQNAIFSKVPRIYVGQPFAVPPQSIIHRSSHFLCDGCRELFICRRSVDINSTNTGRRERCEKILCRPLRLFSGYKALI